MWLLDAVVVDEDSYRPPDLLVDPFSDGEVLQSDDVERVSLEKLHALDTHPHLVNTLGDSREHLIDNRWSEVLDDGFQLLDSTPQDHFLSGSLPPLTM